MTTQPIEPNESILSWLLFNKFLPFQYHSKQQKVHKFPGKASNSKLTRHRSPVVVLQFILNTSSRSNNSLVKKIMMLVVTVENS